HCFISATQSTIQDGERAELARIRLPIWVGLWSVRAAASRQEAWQNATSKGRCMSTADIGLIGLAVMGSNLALNIAEKGYTIAVHNRTASRIDEFVAEAKEQGLDGKVIPKADLAEFIQTIKRPRSIIIMVKA